MPCYAIEDLVPVVHPSSFVHPTAVLIGDVIVGENCYIGPNSALRGDFGRIIVGDGCNVQDTCVVHSFPNRDCIIESDGHIGHGAVLHGCKIGRNSLIGMNAVVMDNAVIGEESLVAATAFVKSGFQCSPRSLVIGSPALVKTHTFGQRGGMEERSDPRVPSARSPLLGIAARGASAVEDRGQPATFRCQYTQAKSRNRLDGSGPGIASSRQGTGLAPDVGPRAARDRRARSRASIP